MRVKQDITPGLPVTTWFTPIARDRGSRRSQLWAWPLPHARALQRAHRRRRRAFVQIAGLARGGESVAPVCARRRREAAPVAGHDHGSLTVVRPRTSQRLDTVRARCERPLEPATGRRGPDEMARHPPFDRSAAGRHRAQWHRLEFAPQRGIDEVGSASGRTERSRGTAPPTGRAGADARAPAAAKGPAPSSGDRPVRRTVLDPCRPRRGQCIVAKWGVVGGPGGADRRG